MVKSFVNENGKDNDDYISFTLNLSDHYETFRSRIKLLNSKEVEIFKCINVLEDEISNEINESLNSKYKKYLANSTDIGIKGGFSIANDSVIIPFRFDEKEIKIIITMKPSNNHIFTVKA